MFVEGSYTQCRAMHRASRGNNYFTAYFFPSVEVKNFEDQSISEKNRNKNMVGGFFLTHAVPYIQRHTIGHTRVIQPSITNSQLILVNGRKH